MSKRANPTLIGIFVMAAIGLVVAGVLVLSGGGLFEEHFSCVAFFEESIDGLDVGAPVEFQGVRVGTVTDVRLIVDRAVSKQIIRPVTFRLESARIGYVGDEREYASVQEAMCHMVEEGMRARLASQSMLTGKLKVELGLFPDTPIRRCDTAIKSVWQMPTVPSPLARVAEEVRELPLKEIVYDVHAAIKGISEIVSSDSTRQAVSSAAGALKEIEAMAAGINKELEPMARQASESLATMNETLKKMEQLLADVEPVIDPFIVSATELSNKIGEAMEKQSPLRYQTQCALEEITQAARSLRYLTDYLERHPESLVRGKK